MLEINKELTSMQEQFKEEKAKIDQEKCSEELKLKNVRDQIKNEKQELENLRKKKKFETGQIKQELSSLMKQKSEFEVQFSKELCEKDKKIEEEKLRIMKELERLTELESNTYPTSDERRSSKYQTPVNRTKIDEMQVELNNEDIFIEEGKNKNSYQVGIVTLKQNNKQITPNFNKEIDFNLHKQPNKYYNIQKNISRKNSPMTSVTEQLFDDTSGNTLIEEGKNKNSYTDENSTERKSVNSERFKIKTPNKKKQTLEEFKKEKLQEAFYDKILAEYIIDKNVLDSKRKFISGHEHGKPSGKNDKSLKNNIFSKKNRDAPDINANKKNEYHSDAELIKYQNTQITNQQTKFVPYPNGNNLNNQSNVNNSLSKKKEPLSKHTPDRKKFNIKILQKNSASAVFEHLKSTLENSNPDTLTKDLCVHPPQHFETIEDEIFITKDYDPEIIRNYTSQSETNNFIMKAQSSNNKLSHQKETDSVCDMAMKNRTSVMNNMDKLETPIYNKILDKKVDNFFNTNYINEKKKQPESPNIGKMPILSYKDKYQNVKHNTVSKYSQLYNYKNKEHVENLKDYKNQEQVDMLKKRAANNTSKEKVNRYHVPYAYQKYQDEPKNPSASKEGRLLFHDSFPQGEMLNSSIDYRLLNKIMKEYNENKLCPHDIS